MKIYTYPNGVEAYLETRAGISCHGAPVVILRAPAQWPGVEPPGFAGLERGIICGPADYCAGERAASLVVRCVDFGPGVDGDGGTIHPIDTDAARAFCSQWPEGPQPRPKEVTA